MLLIYVSIIYNICVYYIYIIYISNKIQYMKKELLMLNKIKHKTDDNFEILLHATYKNTICQ